MNATKEEEAQRNDAKAEPREVVVVDFDMPFVSIVYLMVKWAIASIPAAVILVFIWAMLGGMFLGALRR